MQDVAVIEAPAAGGISLAPSRARMLAELAEPHTATTLAARLGLSRQKVNYHVKTLEQHGLVELVEERRKGNMTERVVQASAAAYVISPAALSALAPDPARSPDRLSARWLLARAGPGVDSWLMGRTESDSASKSATFTMFGEVANSSITVWEPGHRFATQEDKKPDGTFTAMEWLIESREGGGAVGRFVHRGLLGDDSEAEYDGL